MFFSPWVLYLLPVLMLLSNLSWFTNVTSFLLGSTVIPLSLPATLWRMSNGESNPYANTKVFHWSIHLLFSRRCAWSKSTVGPRAGPSAGWNILTVSWRFFPLETFGYCSTVEWCCRQCVWGQSEFFSLGDSGFFVVFVWVCLVLLLLLLVLFLFLHGCSENSLFFIYFQNPAILLGYMLVLIVLHKIFFPEAWYVPSICKLGNFQIYALSMFSSLGNLIFFFRIVIFM